jgi:hypothetical protein
MGVTNFLVNYFKQALLLDTCGYISLPWLYPKVTEGRISFYPITGT